MATDQLLEALLPGVWVLMFFRADLVKPARFWVHHGPGVLKHLHVQPLPNKRYDVYIRLHAFLKINQEAVTSLSGIRGGEPAPN